MLYDSRWPAAGPAKSKLAESYGGKIRQGKREQPAVQREIDRRVRAFGRLMWTSGLYENTGLYGGWILEAASLRIGSPLEEKKNGLDLSIQAADSITYFWSEL